MAGRLPPHRFIHWRGNGIVHCMQEMTETADPARRRLAPYLVVLAAALLSGCVVQERGTPEACAYAVGLDLDSGEYESALTRLDSAECRASMTDHEIEINRAAAYLGIAEYDIADLLLIVLSADAGDDDEDADRRLLQSLTGLGASGAALRYVTEANRAYGRMMTAFPDGIDEACREENVHLLSRLQRDACFTSGLFAYARLARSFDLLLNNALDAFLGLVPLDCNNDRNASGIADEAEISACALHARTRLDSGGGVCRPAGTRQGVETGAVRWERIAGIDQVPFFENGQNFATLLPIRITVEPGGICEADRTAMRFLQPSARNQVIVTDGLCETEVTRTCSAPDTDQGCWPCPIPRLEGQGAMSVTETLLSAVNVEAERWLGVLTGDDADRMKDELEELRENLCEPANGDPELECEITDADSARLTLDALKEYLRQ